MVSCMEDTLGVNIPSPPGVEIVRYAPEHALPAKELLANHSDKHIRTISRAALSPQENGSLPDPVKAWIALKNGEVVGYSAADGTYSITVVHRDHRGQGIGSALIAIKAADCGGPMRTKIGATNVASINAVLKAGFRLVRAGIYEHGPEKGIPYLEFVRD